MSEHTEDIAEHHAPHMALPTGAKIIATLGPASSSANVIHQLIVAGVSIFRLNFSHGSLDDHAVNLATVREVAEELGLPVAVMGDLQGPKIRVGKIPSEGLELASGEDVIFTVGETVQQVAGGPKRLPCLYGGIVDEVLPGHRVLINDGLVRCLAIEPSAGDPPDILRARVIAGGLVTSGKGINLPDSEIQAPAVTERDWECVEWGVKRGVDFLALSFVREAKEVQQLRDALAGMCSIDRTVGREGEGATIPVIAKIEKPQAVEQIEGILKAADGIMVARGDLGVEMDLAMVPIVQRSLIERAAAWAKPCIVATQMLETMIERSTPTRAEVSDVANAVFDGADAVMLSGETAVGRDPALVVETMRRVVAAAEAHASTFPDITTAPECDIESHHATASLALGAKHVANRIDARLVVVWSQRGATARYLSQMNFRIPILAYSSDVRQERRMVFLRRVTPLHTEVPEGGSLAAWNRMVDQQLIERGWVSAGEPVVLLAGRPLGESGSAKMIAIHYIGSPTSGFLREC